MTGFTGLELGLGIWKITGYSHTHTPHTHPHTPPHKNTFYYYHTYAVNSCFLDFRNLYTRGSQLYFMEGQRGKFKIYTWGSNEHHFQSFSHIFQYIPKVIKGPNYTGWRAGFGQRATYWKPLLYTLLKAMIHEFLDEWSLQFLQCVASICFPFFFGGFSRLHPIRSQTCAFYWAQDITVVNFI